MGQRALLGPVTSLRLTPACLANSLMLMALVAKMEPISCRRLLEPLSWRERQIIGSSDNIITKVSCSKEVAEGTGLEPA